ncbi:acyl-CoA thioesterase [Dissulfurirhabdus thermomarina]|uniref:Acyl-CoA thioesterase n=1 Tax=Dissulfurirhabdus thermomarina TaxID=1765737 RepID=A0A6N9TJ71_DISTH|nr:thioesterase family protein [Dissulfurirhabdus thermomarina]NDY41302.1 acyl-CoA thioesterase [Dissulfurirhabdus thermomarina]NMX23759.1 acyl-CoA thioesterase [Dissulfurirhabdus thermomarina]
MRWFETTLRVRFNEVDPWGVVWYANYFAYVEAARAELLDRFRLLPGELRRLGFTAPVIRVRADYKAPARFHDRLRVRLGLRPSEAAKLVFRFRIDREADAARIMEGETEQVLLRDGSILVYKLKGPLKERIEAMSRWFEGDVTA